MKGDRRSVTRDSGPVGLSLLEVEERSLQLAQEWVKPSYQISASWLGRVERENHELSATKVLVLAAIYNVPAQEMLSHSQPGNGRFSRFPNSPAPIRHFY